MRGRIVCRRGAGVNLGLAVALMHFAPFALGCRATAPGAADLGAGDLAPAAFGAPQPVTIAGWDGDAMEPFISGDDQVLLFNDLNSGPNPELHWARRTGPSSFSHMGLIASANSPQLDGVPSLTDDGRLVFVSTRSYDTTASTLYQAQFADGVATGVALIAGVSRATPGIVEFDAEISRDGGTLYYVVSQFSTAGQPQTADLHVADAAATGFQPREDGTLAAINTDALEYAPAIARSGLELYFTRLASTGVPTPQLYVATRASLGEPFGPPALLTTITGFVEGPSISSDGGTLYFHRQDPQGFRIYAVTRR